MEITLEELLHGKSTKIKNKEYKPTEYFVTPFLEKMQKFTNDFRIQVQLPKQITTTKESDDITYNRVWIQAVLPDEYTFDNHQEVVGMVYGLDVKKPIFKIYRGGLNMACTNLTVFNPSFLNIQPIEVDKDIDYNPIYNIMESTNDLKVWLEKLHSIQIPYDVNVINENLGKWIRNSLLCDYDNNYGQVKIATSTVINAYKSIYIKEDSPYYILDGKSTSMFNIYNAFTQIIRDDSKDIMNKVEKTLLLKEILEF